MPYNIAAILSDPTVESKVELITYFINRLIEQKSNKEFEPEIRNFLFKKENLGYFKSYCQIGPKYALGCSVGRILSFYVRSNENSEVQITLLNELLDRIKGFQPSSNLLLKKTTTVKLFDILFEFGLPLSFLTLSANKTLRIYYIPYEHKVLNGAYFPYLNSIELYKSKEKYPEYVFMHEIGHLIAYNLTGNPEKVPESFIKFSSTYNPDYDGDLVEIFVDLFSMAAMMDTEYASENPILQEFDIEDQKEIKNYFVQLMNTIKARS